MDICVCTFAEASVINNVYTGFMNNFADLYKYYNYIIAIPQIECTQMMCGPTLMYMYRCKQDPKWSLIIWMLDIPVDNCYQLYGARN